MTEYDIWEREEDLENIRKAVGEFEGRMSAEIRRQKKLDRMKEKDFRRRVSSSQTVDLVFLYFTFYFYFLFDLFFYFLFLEQLGLGLIGHAVTSVTI